MAKFFRNLILNCNKLYNILIRDNLLNFLRDGNSIKAKYV